MDSNSIERESGSSAKRQRRRVRRDRKEEGRDSVDEAPMTHPRPERGKEKEKSGTKRRRWVPKISKPVVEEESEPVASPSQSVELVEPVEPVEPVERVESDAKPDAKPLVVAPSTDKEKIQRKRKEKEERREMKKREKKRERKRERRKQFAERHFSEEKEKKGEKKEKKEERKEKKEERKEKKEERKEKKEERKEKKEDVFDLLALQSALSVFVSKETEDGKEVEEEEEEVIEEELTEEEAAKRARRKEKKEEKRRRKEEKIKNKSMHSCTCASNISRSEQPSIFISEF
eukprot:TRINITY_DN527_c0_g1_i1.p1 TRINITY_DN527_c0_g1~~TRINITY_DN527_c0_g1_i1.p1  ORF type:complete len:331 (-),score=149.81 TRINITY_DN527_c0_g1_i1:120-986(-)